ncbi:MAG: hypothetical protein M1511_19860 [Deltaproteobacteria bacterium]|nr:hypothetical protein [Deltaproteobacteria bacterium]
MTKVGEAEIDEKFRELVALIKAATPDRIVTLKDMLEKGVEYEETGNVSKATKGCKSSRRQNSNNH